MVSDLCTKTFWITLNMTPQVMLLNTDKSYQWSSMYNSNFCSSVLLCENIKLIVIIEKFFIILVIEIFFVCLTSDKLNLTFLFHRFHETFSTTSLLHILIFLLHMWVVFFKLFQPMCFSLTPDSSIVFLIIFHTQMFQI